jgi:hypothetical protein
MAQGDMNVANQGFPAFRADLNDQLEALVTNSSGATAPATTFPHQWWLDTSTTPSTLRQRNAANDAWIVIGLVDQSANKLILSNPEYTGTLTGGTGVINIGSGQLYKDASGNVGIGTSSPGRRLAVIQNNASQINFGTAVDNGGFLVSTGDDQAIISGGAFWNGSAWQAASTSAQLIGQSNGRIEFSTNTGLTVGNTFTPTERMRIDSSGNLLIGTTTLGTTHAYFQAVSDNRRLLNLGSSTTSGIAVAIFRNPNGGVGSIQTSGSSTSYATSSDYRLKEDWQPMSGAITRLNQLKPVNFAWKVDGSRVDGFLAHEAQEVVPEAVTGTKDAVDAEGNPEYQGIDQAKLVPLLTAALQEAVAEINSLKARVEALEGTQP